MSQDEVIAMLQSDKVVPIGQENDRVHFLFHSLADAENFIAVVDTKTRQIITVLPSCFHARWRISKEAEASACQLTGATSPGANWLVKRGDTLRFLLKRYPDFVELEIGDYSCPNPAAHPAQVIATCELRQWLTALVANPPFPILAAGTPFYVHNHTKYRLKKAPWLKIWSQLPNRLIPARTNVLNQSAD